MQPQPTIEVLIGDEKFIVEERDFDPATMKRADAIEQTPADSKPVDEKKPAKTK